MCTVLFVRCPTGLGANTRTLAPSGYTLLERYLSWLAAPHATSTAGAAVNLDLSAVFTMTALLLVAP